MPSDVLNPILSDCTECGACVSQCAFLQKYGTPKAIANRLDFSRPDHQQAAFECSLCGLCDAVCPEKLAPSELFLTVRRASAAAGHTELKKYRPILNYEKRGMSPRFTFCGLPDGCDVVFFPGCTLPGTRPAATWQLFEYLRGVIPNLGVVLNCCAKPSHDLGRQDFFEAAFSAMREYLKETGVRHVLTACPNCYKIFSAYGDGLSVQTVYEIISANGLPKKVNESGRLAVHDPCPLRLETGVQDAVRGILTRMGLAPEEMKHRRNRTLCCGEGGGVGFVQPDLARQWSAIRRKEAEGRKLVTYCAGCAGFLNRTTPTVHILDVLFFPEKALNGGLRPAPSPFTYLNRLRLKRRFAQALGPAVSRPRDIFPNVTY